MLRYIASHVVHAVMAATLAALSFPTAAYSQTREECQALASESQARVSSLRENYYACGRGCSEQGSSACDVTPTFASRDHSCGKGVSSWRQCMAAEETWHCALQRQRAAVEECRRSVGTREREEREAERLELEQERKRQRSKARGSG